MERNKKHSPPSLQPSSRGTAFLESYPEGDHTTQTSNLSNRRASGRQLAFLARLVSDLGTVRIAQIKEKLGLAGISALDLSSADASRLITELRRMRRSRRR